MYIHVAWQGKPTFLFVFKSIILSLCFYYTFFHNDHTISALVSPSSHSYLHSPFHLPFSRFRTCSVCISIILSWYLLETFYKVERKLARERESKNNMPFFQVTIHPFMYSHILYIWSPSFIDTKGNENTKKKKELLKSK